MRKLLNTLYVTDPKAFLCKAEKNLLVQVEGRDKLKIPFHILENITLFGYLGCTPSVLGECADRGISISFLDESGHFKARVEGATSGNVLLRRKQYRMADDLSDSLQLAHFFIAAKIRNSRSVLQRHKRDNPQLKEEMMDRVIKLLENSVKKVSECKSLDQLRGIEGDAAHIYFSVFNRLIKNKEISDKFTGRVKRPPTDPINAMLSFFYSILNNEIRAACETVGLDPQVGFLHKDRPGRASLSLDLIEEMRAYCVDRFVLSLFNRKQLSSADFEYRIDGSVFLNNDIKKRVLNLWQERKHEEITHPFLGEKMSAGLLPYVQVQLLARYIRGDLEIYPAFLWR